MVSSRSGVAGPVELAILAETVDSFCTKHGIDDTDGREVVAARCVVPECDGASSWIARFR